MINKHKVILFANTLWFLHNFKLPLIEELKNKQIDRSNLFKIRPSIGNKNKFLLNNVKQYTFINYFLLY